MLDFGEAFDLLERDFIHTVMKKLIFGGTIIVSRYKLLTKRPYNVKNNGCLCRKVYM